MNRRYHHHRRLSLCVLLGLLITLVSSGTAATPSPHTVRSLDEGWRFHLGAEPAAIAPEFDDSGWRRVDVPHDYAIEGTFSEKNPVAADTNDPQRADWYWLHGFLPVQPAVYRKTLDLPASAAGQRLWLEFDGVFSNSRYWLNGHEIGAQYSGYTRSRFDITAFARPGARNIITVQVDPRYDGWWYEGAGIYRHVRLVTVDPIHIAPDGVFVIPSVADPGDGLTADATVVAHTDVTNTSSASASATVTNEILDAEGRSLGSSTSTYEIGVSGSQRITQQLLLPRANLWSPAHPHLYRLRTTVALGDRTVDQLVTNFGVRHVRFDADHGFFLNGQRLQLQGVNMHQDHAGVGVAMPDRLFTWRLERLKEMGCNAIRTSHNPVAPFLLDECDRLGFLVVAENRHLGDGHVDQTPKDAVAVAHRDLSALVLRDRNHPSIILWSLCNEQWIQGTPESAALISAMRQRVAELDPTRPVTAAMNGGFENADGMGSALPVIGINYNPGVYDSFHRLFPQTPLFASEIASEISTRGIYATKPWETYFGDRERGYVSAYSITAGPAGQTVEKAWPPVAAREFIGGGFVWAAFDYKGEPRPFGWPVVNCHYGFMDICGFPKDSYYYYKAAWTPEPVLHLFPHWNWAGQEGQEIPVWVHSNCEEVELLLNGVSLGRQKVTPLQHLEWKVKYAPGRLVARGLYQGRWIETTRETTGAPAALRLTADRATLAAGNADLAVVRVEVVDAQGRVVPTAGNKITFAVTGPAKLIGVGNGDPTCLEPDQGSSRSAFNGLAQALVQTTSDPGAITLQAESPDLQSAALQLVSR